MYEELQTDEQQTKFREERKRLSENHFNRANNLGAWLLATLSATNLAAAAAILAYAKGGPSIAARPAFAFAAGVVLAVLSGFIGTTEARWRASLYYLESYGEERLTDKGLKRLKNTQRWTPYLSHGGRLLNYASLTAFIVGACWVSLSFNV